MKQEEQVVALDNATAIRALADRFVTTFNAGDIDGIMKNYLPDNRLIVYDIVPRKQHIGAAAYREAFVEMFTHFKGRPQIAIADLNITVDGDVGFGHCFMHVTGTGAQGDPVDRWVRVTNGYRKIGRNWFIALEHISVPVDFSTGKLVPITKP